MGLETKLEVRLEGIEKVNRMAEQMGRAFTEREKSSIYRFGLNDVRRQMRLNLPDNRTGSLYHSVGITITKVDGVLSGIVGPRRKRGRWDQQGQAAYLVELGTKPHTIRSKYGKMMPVYKRGQYIGHYPAIQHPGTTGKRPFSRAIDSEMNGVNRRMILKAQKVMERVIMKNK